mgnify:CR=1 FL=1
MHQSPVALISALDFELSYFDSIVTVDETLTVSGKQYTTGNFEGYPVVRCHNAGVGKVQCAIAVMTLLERFQPSTLFFTGVAAGMNDSLNIGDVVVAKELAYHDRGFFNDGEFIPGATWNARIGTHNPLRIPATNDLLKLVSRAGRGISDYAIKQDGLIITGDQILSDVEKRESLQKIWQADALEMEGAVVAEICHQHAIPFTVIRGISDKGGEVATTREEFERYSKLAANNAAQLTAETIRLWIANQE